jgi:hypothetical protein
VDQIRPIGPVERDLAPVVRVTRSDPDAQRERDEHPEPRKESPREPPPQPPADDEDGSLIDVRV